MKIKEQQLFLRHVMNYPKMLIMRNEVRGLIWQAYLVMDEQEERILTKNANINGFIVQQEPQGYTEETTPCWRESVEWQTCLAKDQND
jgi:hypothetical protein